MNNYDVVQSLGLAGKIVAVVGGGGANNGIGRATAILFAKLGAKVSVLDINREAAAETARLINAVTENAASIWQLDALNKNQVDRTVKEILEKYNRIDAWVQLVGGHNGRTLIEEIPLRRMEIEHRDQPDERVHRLTRNPACHEAAEEWQDRPGEFVRRSFDLGFRR